MNDILPTTLIMVRILQSISGVCVRTITYKWNDLSSSLFDNLIRLDHFRVKFESQGHISKFTVTGGKKFTAWKHFRRYNGQRTVAGCVVNNFVLTMNLLKSYVDEYDNDDDDNESEWKRWEWPWL